MNIHKLKSWPKPFEQVWEGSKRHEIRNNDRHYEQGDELLLMEFNPHTKQLSGRTISAVVGNVTDGGSWGLPADLCAFSLLHVVPHEVEDNGSRLP